MRNRKFLYLAFLSLFLLESCSNHESSGIISFYSVPLVCGAAPEIGCGSRIKPLFIDLESEKGVKEVWTNREGTVLAVKWADPIGSTGTLFKLFDKHKIEAEPISDKKITDSLQAALMKTNNTWLRGMAVDSLSLYEAGVIAHTLTDFAKEAGLVNLTEQDNIRRDLELYFRKELVKVRTSEELNSEECRDEWKRNGFLIYQKHIGKDRAERVASYFDENEISITKMESCCSEEEEDKCCEKKEEEMVEHSTITCPYCGHKKLEKLPTDVCQIRYTCENCKKEITPKVGDCCVYCSYGDHKCPSKQ